MKMKGDYLMYYYPGLEETVTSTPSIPSMGVWGIVALVIAIIGGIVLYYLFVNTNKKVNNKFLDACKNFLSFKKMLIEDLLKIIYLVLAIFITLISFELITTSFFGFIFTLVFGNLVLRVVFESILVNIMIWKNTTEINKKIK